MVTYFKRRKHQRTNARGTTFDVKSHDVFLNFSITSIRGRQKIVNEHSRLMEDICRNCYNKVYFISLSDNRKIFFNNDSNPLVRHDCLGKKQQKEHYGKLKNQEKLYADQAEVFRRRFGEIKKRPNEANDIPQEKALKKQEKRKRQSQLKKEPHKKKQKRLLVGITIARIDEQLEKLLKEEKKLAIRGSDIEKMIIKLKIIGLELEKIKARKRLSSNEAKYGYQIEKKEVQILKLKNKIKKY